MSYQKPYPEYFDTIPYPRSFWVPDLAKFMGDDAKTTYEHIGQFLAQVNDVGITDMHKIRMFLLSLTRAAFNWFTSKLDRFLGYFGAEIPRLLLQWGGRTKLSDLTSLRQKYTKTVSDYLRWFREVRYHCYNLTIVEKDLADPAFVGLTPYLRVKLDGQEFSDSNQLLQHVLPYVNHAKSSRFRDSTNKDKEKHHINFVDEEADDEEGNEWVENPGDKPISCSFLKHNGGWREEMRYTFGVSK
jgi:hypothetical protein